MDLREDREAIVGEPLDDVRLPQRPRAIEWAPDDAGYEVGELLLVAGGRYGSVAHVKVEIEVGVVDPERVVEPHRHVAHLAAQWLEEVEALVDLGAPRVERAVLRVVGFGEDRQA